ncbi:MAG: ankyrin repeat domain-containing protein [Acidobacteria bacterium]|nr:ankyrin repeat domain-containing protein [Acidobacteriota bacterium]
MQSRLTPMPRAGGAFVTACFTALSVLPAASLLAAPTAADDRRLPDAARDGDRAVIARLLAEAVDVDAAAVDGTTALHWAVYRDDAELAGALLDAGADPDVVNRNGATPLGLACAGAGARLVTVLLDAGADPGLAPRGEAPLLTCAHTGAVAAVRALLSRGADIDAADTWRGQTPLMWAAAENHVPVMNVLLEGGAAVDAASTGGFTALMFAVRQDARDAARLLLAAGADLDARAPNGQSLLRMAITNRHYPLATLLLARGADPTARDSQGNTALHDLVAARALQRRPQVPAAVSEGAALHATESLELMRLLLEAGADPNARTEPRPRLTDARAQAGGRPAIDNQVNMGGATPYTAAARGADHEAMRLLAEHGADPRLATYANNTALTLAAGVVFTEGLRLQRPEPDVLAAVELALAHGVDIDGANAHGQTALHGAVYRAADSVIRHLIAAGARTDLADELDRTPLDLAEQGFNQAASVIRRDRSAALLRELGAVSSRPAAPADASP